MTEQLLDIRGLAVSRGPGEVLRDVNLAVRAGELAVLLGANGAGKSTLLDAVSGLVATRAGEVRFDGEEVSGLSRTRRARLGIRHVEQGRAIFGDLTVAENLAVVAPRQSHAEALEQFPELRKRMDVRAAMLSGGEQQMLVLARALLSPASKRATGTRLLLLDELSLGLAPIVVARLLPIVRSLTDRGITVLLVEQFAHLVLPIADTVHVLDRGTIVFSGTQAELEADPRILHKAYLAA
ncbi:ABC transporter ATP-binding protein [Streptomyces neyagawaensis]|uniref:ABC transporter ATP-binding protein n=1 Tax=Streptomyces neyagawaensis TaxID=42238 RepID=UPI0006E32745|nr:ATP-binding cassette domain-containing protein [Streptomyces neyagawaensis]MCL6737471.1 ATP-binding cassette domain-containing protein [Streptomyces neyagawaensis]MDE1688244.1 ATP-binding cassette domain-containing protein [Streptomyces neyagawaensis]